MKQNIPLLLLSPAISFPRSPSPWLQGWLDGGQELGMSAFWMRCHYWCCVRWHISNNHLFSCFQLPCVVFKEHMSSGSCDVIGCQHEVETPYLGCFCKHQLEHKRPGCCQVTLTLSALHRRFRVGPTNLMLCCVHNPTEFRGNLRTFLESTYRGLGCIHEGFSGVDLFLSFLFTVVKVDNKRLCGWQLNWKTLIKQFLLLNLDTEKQINR